MVFLIGNKKRIQDTLNYSICGMTCQDIIIKYELKEDTKALCFKHKQNKNY